MRYVPLVPEADEESKKQADCNGVVIGHGNHGRTCGNSKKFVYGLLAIVAVVVFVTIVASLGS